MFDTFGSIIRLRGGLELDRMCQGKGGLKDWVAEALIVRG